MKKVERLTYASSLTDIREINSSFDTGILRVCYVGQNRNNSFLSKEDIEAHINTIYNCPIVCNYDRDTDSLGGHDMELVTDDDGSMHLVNLTQPVGVIPESAKYWWDEYTEDDGTVNTYLYVEALLWKRQEAYTKIKEDGITSHSMELNIIDGYRDGSVYHIKDFEFTAFALIGVTPCFESSALEVFSRDDVTRCAEEFKLQMGEMMQDLKEAFSLVSSSNEDNNTHQEVKPMEGEVKTLNEKMELCAKYGIDVETLNFSIDDFTIEELTEKFEEMMNAPEENAEPEKVDEEQPAEEAFALESNLREEIVSAICSEMIQTEWGAIPRYSFVDYDADACMVYAWDREDWLLYGFSYSMNGDSVRIDMECKKRMKYTIVEFDEGEQESPFSNTYAEMSDRLHELSDIKEKFESATNQMNEMNAELEELRKFKLGVEHENALSERVAIMDKFEDLSDVEAFNTLRENCMNYDLETLEDKCYAIRGRMGMPAKFSAENEKSPKLPIDGNGKDAEFEPYGGVFKKYGIA